MSKPLFYALSALTLAGFLIAPHLVFQVAPEEPLQGFIQKIFYYHVPAAWVMLVSAVLCGVAGGIFLFGRRAWADWLSTVMGEITVVFGVLVLSTGPLWAKKAWGQYWVWDARLTTLLLLFLTFLGVMLARRYAGPTARRIAAGVALFGAVNVPLVYLSVRIWKTNHPNTKVVMTLTPSMRAAFFVSLAAFTLLFVLLAWAGMRLERMRAEVEDLAVQADELTHTRRLAKAKES